MEPTFSVAQWVNEATVKLYINKELIISDIIVSTVEPWSGPGRRKGESPARI